MKTRSEPSRPASRRRGHPSERKQPGSPGRRRQPAVDAAALIPPGADRLDVDLDGKRVALTNLEKVFWPEGRTKGDLVRYYVAVAPALLPHLADRAMTMKRYPHGAAGPYFFMKRAPAPRPAFIETCAVLHGSGNVIDFPVVQDLASLLWVVNLGCIDLNQSYARCDDMDRPDFLHFDLDPVPPATFEQVRATAFLVRDALAALGLRAQAKTSGSKGVHVYVAIERGPTQHEVWGLAKRFAQSLEHLRPDLVTAEYKVAARPRGRVLVDFNQNAWGRTLASVYSVRPTPRATVSTPVDWEELAAGARVEDFRIDNVPARVAARGDLWAPMVAWVGRARLEELL